MMRRTIAVVAAAAVGSLGLAAPAEAALPVKVAIACEKVTTDTRPLPVCTYVKYKQRASGKKRTVGWMLMWDRELGAPRSHDNMLRSCGKVYRRDRMKNGIWYAARDGNWCFGRDSIQGVLDGPLWFNAAFSTVLR